MIEYIIPALVVVLPSAGFVGGAIWATRGRDEYVATLKRRNAILKVVNTALHQELSTLVAEKQRRLAPLKAANADRHAKRLDREAQARLIQQATHDGMRAKLGLGELV